MFKNFKNTLSSLAPSLTTSLTIGILSAFSLIGCSSPTPYDYTALRASHPRSILILPPVNHTNNVNAPNSVLSTLTMPLAEGGYYVIPVTVMNETFHQNGMTISDEIQKTPIDKLHQIFGADAVLYVTIEDYGNYYHIVEQRASVSVSAQLIDLRTGVKLWEGKALAVNSSGIAIDPLSLIAVAVDQAISSMTEQEHSLSYVVADSLLNPYNATRQTQQNALLPGPYREPNSVPAPAAPPTSTK